MPPSTTELLGFNRLFSADVLQSKEGENSPLNGYGKIKSAQIVMKIRIYLYFCIVSGKIIIVEIVEFFLSVHSDDLCNIRMVLRNFLLKIV